MATRFIPGSFFRIGSYGQIGAGSESAFVSTWNTENLGGTSSATKVILLPWTNPGIDVDWGDGTVNQLNTHTYAAGGIKTVRISDTVTGFRFNNAGDRLKIITVASSGNLVFDNSSQFYGCENMTTFITSSTSTVTTTQPFNMFRDCKLLVTLNISNFDMGSATLLNNFFRNLAVIVNLIGIEDLDISSATSMVVYLEDTTLSTAQYDAILINYEAQSVQNNVTFSGGNSTYSAGAAATARAALINDHSWSITDGGAA